MSSAQRRSHPALRGRAAPLYDSPDLQPAWKALRPINAQSSGGGAPCYVSATPDAVLVANYLGGNAALLPIRPDGGLAAASDVEQHEGSSVNEERQEAPHAHFIAPDPSGRHALVADLGIDEVVIYRLETTELERVGAAQLAPGAGPRHLAFHPTENLVYVINELNSTVTSFVYDHGRMERAQTVSTLPHAFRGESFCADIHVSADGRFVYGSNRGHNSIVVFETEPGGGLRPIQHVSAGGSWPRNFAIAPSGTLLLVANQRSNNVVVLATDPDSGRLAPTDHSLDVPSPVCLRFLDT